MKKKILFPVTIAVILTAVGGTFAYRNSKNVVDVYAVNTLQQMYWGNSNSYSGNVYEAQSQNVYVDSTQKIQELYVTLNQHVQAGDPLIRFDTDSVQLTLAMKNIELEKLQNEQKSNEFKLQKLRTTTPVPDYVPSPEPEPTPEPTPEPSKEPVKEKVEDAYTVIEKVEDKYTKVVNKEPAPEPSMSPESTAVPTVEPEPTPAASAEPEEGTDREHPIRFIITSNGKICTTLFDELKEKKKEKVYLSFEYHEENKADKDILNSWIVRADQVSYEGKQYFTLPEVNVTQSHNADISVANAVVDTPFTGNGGFESTSGYTAAELLKAIKQTEASMRTLNIDIKRKQLEISELNDQLSDGIVYAKKDGVIVTLGDLEQPALNGKPFITVSAQKGTYIKSVVSEFMLGTVKPGNTVTVRSWMTGSSYTATIQSIDAYPDTSNMYNYGGNSNCSYYGIYAFIEEDTDLTAYDGLDITFDQESTESDALWMPVAYIRKDVNDKYYVYKDNNGKLQKQFVTIGQIDSGYVMEVKEGLSSEDYIAFPYGKKVREGTKTNISEEGGMW